MTQPPASLLPFLPGPAIDRETAAGWERWRLTGHSFVPAPRLQWADYQRLSPRERRLHDLHRAATHANLPFQETPMSAAVAQIMSSRIHNNALKHRPTTRAGLLLNGGGYQGKTETACEVAAAFADQWLALHGQHNPDAVAGTRDQHLPVAYVQTPVTATPKMVCEAILGFYGADHKKMTLGQLIRASAPRCTTTAPACCCWTTSPGSSCTGGGEGAVPLVLLQHFRGNLDNWDPALIDTLASTRRVVTFDNAGVGGSTGTTPDTIEQMARDAIAFIAAMELSQVDLLGYSIGSFVAQQIALMRPAIVRRLVLASSAPQGAAGMHGWAPEVIGAIGTPKTSPEAYLDVFFARSASSRQAGQQALQRMYARTVDRDGATTWATREAQYDAVCSWGTPNHGLLQRLSAIGMPVFVANGDSDPMILPRYSYLLAGLIPQAQVKIYPDSAHGFLFQHHAEFAADVEAFLTGAS